MDYLEPQLRQFLPSEAPKYPLPWHDWSEGGHSHVSTDRYARLLLDAMAGDDRRKAVRRAYRYYCLHCNVYDKERTTGLWIMIEALKQNMHILPPAVSREIMAKVTSLKGA